jgi:hypothetical protein
MHVICKLLSLLIKVQLRVNKGHWLRGYAVTHYHIGGVGGCYDSIQHSLSRPAEVLRGQRGYQHALLLNSLFQLTPMGTGSVDSSLASPIRDSTSNRHIILGVTVTYKRPIKLGVILLKK